MEHEKGEFEQEKLKVDKLKQMKATIATEKPFQKVEATLKIQRENEQKREEIQKVEETNEKRKVGFQQIIEGFEKFLLIEKPPEQKEEGEKEEGEKEEGENEN
ncbi:hypothetical protein TRFO_09894 [Tritrichomonas foetus]|uniref:Uncharacterized protein n=1 Tax=Tritrichomonas foetus TaxID=1144522 RepID=A0A1J4JBJ4_9EUKA|nr:hypothetical protein TRFO_09894 [Tritrichomonas foetus]|eukprot:OHS96512.1 hypothetical protein TRFO_09894 [Tritrichomonas foetus]